MTSPTAIPGKDLKDDVLMALETAGPRLETNLDKFGSPDRGPPFEARSGKNSHVTPSLSAPTTVAIPTAPQRQLHGPGAAGECARSVCPRPHSRASEPDDKDILFDGRRGLPLSDRRISGLASRKAVSRCPNKTPRWRPTWLCNADPGAGWPDHRQSRSELVSPTTQLAGDSRCSAWLERRCKPTPGGVTLKQRRRPCQSTPPPPSRRRSALLVSAGAMMPSRTGCSIKPPRRADVAGRTRRHLPSKSFDR